MYLKSFFNRAFDSLLPVYGFHSEFKSSSAINSRSGGTKSNVGFVGLFSPRSFSYFSIVVKAACKDVTDKSASVVGLFAQVLASVLTWAVLNNATPSYPVVEKPLLKMLKKTVSADSIPEADNA